MSAASILYLGPTVPHLPPLDLQGEADALGAICGANCLTAVLGSITLNDVARLLQGQHYDLVVIGAHGLPGGVQFSDGVAAPSWLALQLQQATPNVVIVGACWSGVRSPDSLRAVGEEIALAGITTVAMVREVGDQSARVYTTEFVRAFNVGASPRTAHLIALEQVQQFSPAATTSIVFVPGQDTAAVTPNSELVQVLAELQRINARLETHAQQAESAARTVTEIATIVRSLEGLASHITSVVQESGVQQRMLEMLYESQQALVRLTTQVMSAK